MAAQVSGGSTTTQPYYGSCQYGPSRSNTSMKDIYSSKSETEHKTIGGNDGDYDSDPAHPQHQNRNREKKFIKNFKHLPSEEIVLRREF